VACFGGFFVAQVSLLAAAALLARPEAQSRSDRLGRRPLQFEFALASSPSARYPPHAHPLPACRLFVAGHQTRRMLEARDAPRFCLREGETMDRSRASRCTVLRLAALLVAVATLITSSGCPALMATGIYVLQGGNLVPAECEALEGQRVVVVCRPPASHEYSYPGASRRVAQRVSELLVENVKDIDVVNPREVDNWVDESDWGDFRELAEAVNADKVVHIEFEDFRLDKGKTLYQGRADVTLTVYDMKKPNKPEWDDHIGEILYPTNSGIPAQDKPLQQFEREFVEIVAEQIAVKFYRHDPHASFAVDALANR
jgi:hypothetical protein